jgi:lipid-A-disaccharide synthase
VSPLLVVAGEASGDRAAAAVLQRLPGVRAFGLGGAALADRGVELVADLRRSTALGVGESWTRAWGVASAWAAIARASKRRRPPCALLVNYSDFNALLAPRLRARGVRVLWYIAPQIWAWRPGRGRSLRASIDRMALVLPFEEALWRGLGVDARYVGHPALETPRANRGAARAILGMTPYAAAVAILPGSRPHEVRALLPAMLDAFEALRADRGAVDARVLVAPSLDDATTRWLRAQCAARRVSTYDVDPHRGALAVLSAFDVSLCSSGTASLEAAIARAIPVVAYRVGWSTEIVARALLRTPNVALPNVLLGKRVFSELLQANANSEEMLAALGRALDHRAMLLGACEELEALLGAERSPSAAVAAMLAPWLDGTAPGPTGP